jgi:hypothetical protein
MMADTNVKAPWKVDYEAALKDAEGSGATAKVERMKLKQQLNVLLGQMEVSRSTFRAHWLDLAYHIAPRRTRFLITDVNRGDKRMQMIIKNTAGRAARTLRAGMMSAVTSPTRPWFRLGPVDKALQDSGPVKQWCYEVTERLLMLIAQTNFYEVMPILYGDGGVFATGVVFAEEDMNSVARFFSLPIGSYSISRDANGRLDTLCRKWRMTVRSVVTEFATNDDGTQAWDKVSDYVKNHFENGNYNIQCDVCHFVIPNPQYRPQTLGITGYPFLSLYFELGAANVGIENSLSYQGQVLPLDRFLRIKGYHHAPVLDFIWERTGEDDYGTSSPGMEALADIRSQQLIMRRIFQAMEYKLRPPMLASPSIKQQKTSILPGDILTANNPNDFSMKPIMEVEFDLADALKIEEMITEEVNAAFLVDLFRMLLDDERRTPPTATEVRELKQEGLLQLGPVMQNLNEGVLNPAVMLMYNFAMQQGRLPEPPKELAGKPIAIEYISLMAQAMKMMDVAGIDRFVTFITPMGQLAPQALDKVDFDAMVEEYGNKLAIPPMIIRPDDKVAEIRAQRQQASQQQAQAQAAAQHAQTAATLSQADTSNPNMLTDLMDQSKAGDVMPDR